MLPRLGDWVALMKVGFCHCRLTLLLTSPHCRVLQHTQMLHNYDSSAGCNKVCNKGLHPVQSINQSMLNLCKQIHYCMCMGWFAVSSMKLLMLSRPADHS
jgi:hypothetical protein